MPFGGLSDKVGRKKLLVSGYIVFALCYLGFAFSNSQPQMVAVFVLYGAYTAMIAGVLWSQFGAAVPFVFGAVMSLLAAGILLLFMKDLKPKTA